MPKQRYIEALTWNDVRPTFLKVYPSLVEVMDQFSFDSSCLFYKVRYPFGAHILKEGRFFLPDETGAMQPLEAFPEVLQKDLSYSYPSHPSGVLTNKVFEQFVTLHGRIIPFYLITPGTFLGVTALLDHITGTQQGLYTSFSMWELTAGARSTFLLSRIADTQAYRVLQRKYALKARIPNNAYEQWDIFKELAEKEAQNWKGEVIFFSNEFIKKLRSPKYAPLLVFMQAENRQVFNFWRNQFSWQVTLSHIERLKHLKYSVHLLDTVKHLLALSLGALPAFKPSSNEDGLPLALLQRIFIEDYKIENLPVMVEHTNFQGTHPVYYSLTYPTSAEYSAKSSTSATNIAELDQLQIIMDKFLKALSQDLGFSHSLLETVATHIRFQFFHSQSDNYHNIASIDELLKFDPRFTTFDLLGPNFNLPFPSNSPFFKGCVGISKL